VSREQLELDGAEARTPKSVIDNGVDRFLADGVHYRDLIQIGEKVTDWNSWPTVWSEAADKAEDRGDALLDGGSLRSAADEFFRAGLYRHYAQYLYFDDVALKEKISIRKHASFEKAATLLDPPVEIAFFPYKDRKIKAYFRRPRGVEKPPCVILIGGLDTTKVDYRNVSDMCLARGLATFAFDGPGQGETAFFLRLNSRYEETVSAAIDYLETRSEVDSKRLGIIGRSMGGYFAPKAAAVDDRIKAMAAWCAFYQIEPMAFYDSANQKGLMFLSDTHSLAEADEFYQFLNLEGVAQKIRCPSLVMHGGLDKATPVKNAYRLADAISGPVTRMIWEDSGHCNHDRSHFARPALADFMAHNLRVASP
jgi:2,6-dihydroxypseudooxynicotine hydrolase